MSVTLKGVAPEILAVLKAEAAERGRSLNSQIIGILSREAAEVKRRKNLDQTLEEVKKFAAAVGPMGDSSALIRADRER